MKKYKFTQFRNASEYEYFLLTQAAIKDISRGIEKILSGGIINIIKNIMILIELKLIIFGIKHDIPSMDKKRWIDAEELVHPEVIPANRATGVFGEVYEDLKDDHGYIMLINMDECSSVPSKFRLFVQLTGTVVIELPDFFDYTGVYFKEDFNIVLGDYKDYIPAQKRTALESQFHYFIKFPDGVILIEKLEE